MAVRAERLRRGLSRKNGRVTSPSAPGLRFNEENEHASLMLAAQSLTALFAVWITHRGCQGEDFIARAQRSRLINYATYNMFYHLEHHLFPAVPVKRLGQLAERLDAAEPAIAAKARRVL